MDILIALENNSVWSYCLIFLSGLCIGSFLNVVITRLPGLIDSNFADQSENQRPNMIRPGSRCPKCKHKINWYDNIPLISYLILKGVCRHCATKISAQYFWVELITGVLFTGCAWKFGFTVLLPWSLILTALLVTLAVIDINTWLLPDHLTLTGIALGLISNLFGNFASTTDAFIGALAGYFVLWLIYQIHHNITHREGMGYGDFKLLAMLGAWMGWQALPIIMLISSLAALIFFIFMKLFYKFDYTRAIPFGPFLAIAGWVYLINPLIY